MNNGWKYVVMHVATMMAVCFLVWSKAEMAVTIGCLTGWFGFISGDKLHAKAGTAYRPASFPPSTQIAEPQPFVRRP